MLSCEAYEHAKLGEMLKNKKLKDSCEMAE